jgi:hypothetical protein
MDFLERFTDKCPTYRAFNEMGAVKNFVTDRAKKKAAFTPGFM